MWEMQEEEPEIQVFKNSQLPEERRYNQRRPSNLQYYSRRELPFYEDTFTKRLGRSSLSNDRRIDQNRVPPATLQRQRRNQHPVGEITRPSLEKESVKVDTRCRWPCINDGDPSLPHESEVQKQPPASISKQLPSAWSVNGKQLKGLGGLLSRKVFRHNETANVYPAWEAEWAHFREQHEQEMKEMKQLYRGLQEMCLELKRIGSHRDDVSGPSSRRVSVSESWDSRIDGAPLVGQSTRDGVMNHTHCPRENGQRHSNRRAKSAPKTRVNWDTGLTKENSMHIPVPYNTAWCCPTTALFEEIVQVERIYLRNFVASLIKYGEERHMTEDSEAEREGEFLSALVDRLVPHAVLAKASHLKYAVEAWLNRVVFKDFGKATYGPPEGRPQGSRARRISSWDEYQRLSLLSPIDAIEPNGKVYYRSFHIFCDRKFQAIHEELEWWDEWPDNLVEDFLEAMKHVWRAHKLALAFEQPASMFKVKSSASFDVKFMEPLEALTVSPSDDLLPHSSQVGFIVTPGFIVQDRIIKSQVYLKPDFGSLEESP